MIRSLSVTGKKPQKAHDPSKIPSIFCTARTYAASAIVTSTSTPGSMLMEVICFTISEGEWRSMTRLWILIWNLSHVLEPSPQGVFLVVILRTLVGILTGPFTFSSLSLAPLIRSWHTFSRDFTFLEVRVILILWTGASSSTPFPSLYAAMLIGRVSDWSPVLCVD